MPIRGKAWFYSYDDPSDEGSDWWGPYYALPALLADAMTDLDEGQFAVCLGRPARKEELEGEDDSGWRVEAGDKGDRAFLIEVAEALPKGGAHE